MWGSLKIRILEALKAAGEAGVSRKALAEQLQLPGRKISCWYQTTGRQIPGVERTSRGLYRFDSGSYSPPLLDPTLPGSQLTQLIVRALKTAGPEGMGVHDLAARTGLTINQVFPWFGNTGKRVPGVERIARGVYRYNPGNFPNPAPDPASTLLCLIIETLNAAGSDGLRIRDLAAQTGLTIKQVNSWFGNIGKRVPGIERIGRGLYRYNPRRYPSPAPILPRTPPKQLIVETLKTAGPEGMGVHTLAARTGLTLSKIRVWYAHTGINVPGIERVFCGVFRFNPKRLPE